MRIAALLAALLIAPALAQPKPPPPLEEAKKSARREIEKWYEGREIAKLYEVAPWSKNKDVDAFVANRKKLAKITWDLVPAALREGVEREEWLAKLAPENRGSITWGRAATPEAPVRLAIAKWEIADLRLSREHVTVRAKVTPAQVERVEKKKLVVRELEETTEVATWIRQGGQLLLDRALDGAGQGVAGEELYDEPWFGGTKTIGHAVRRWASIEADERATQLEREQLREAVTKELDGLIVADAGAVVDVSAEGCVTLRSGRFDTLAWPADKAALEKLRLRKGDWVAVRGRCRPGRWSDRLVGRMEIDQAELKPQP